MRNDFLKWWIPSYTLNPAQETIGGEGGRGLLVMWNGEFDGSVYRHKTIKKLMKIPFWKREKRYLTRLEIRIDALSPYPDIKGQFAFSFEPLVQENLSFCSKSTG